MQFKQARPNETGNAVIVTYLDLAHGVMQHYGYILPTGPDAPTPAEVSWQLNDKYRPRIFRAHFREQISELRKFEEIPLDKEAMEDIFDTLSDAELAAISAHPGNGYVALQGVVEHAQAKRKDDDKLVREQVKKQLAEGGE